MWSPNCYRVKTPIIPSVLLIFCILGSDARLKKQLRDRSQSGFGIAQETQTAHSSLPGWTAERLQERNQKGCITNLPSQGNCQVITAILQILMYLCAG